PGLRRHPRHGVPRHGALHHRRRPHRYQLRGGGSAGEAGMMQNLAPVLVVLALLAAILRAGREPLWGEAYRRLRRSWLAMAALAVMLVYGTVAFLDSVGWRDSQTSARRTVIDRLFERPKERT